MLYHSQMPLTAAAGTRFRRKLLRLRVALHALLPQVFSDGGGGGGAVLEGDLPSAELCRSAAPRSAWVLGVLLRGCRGALKLHGLALHMRQPWLHWYLYPLLLLLLLLLLWFLLLLRGAGRDRLLPLLLLLKVAGRDEKAQPLCFPPVLPRQCQQHGQMTQVLLASVPMCFSVQELLAWRVIRTHLHDVYKHYNCMIALGWYDCM